MEYEVYIQRPWQKYNHLISETHTVKLFFLFIYSIFVTLLVFITLLGSFESMIFFSFPFFCVCVLHTTHTHIFEPVPVYGSNRFSVMYKTEQALFFISSDCNQNFISSNARMLTEKSDRSVELLPSSYVCRSYLRYRIRIRFDFIRWQYRNMVGKKSIEECAMGFNFMHIAHTLNEKCQHFDGIGKYAERKFS